MTVTASAGSDSAILPIFILQTQACIATTASVNTCVVDAGVLTCTNYPAPGSSNYSCPASGTLIPPASLLGFGSSTQPFQVGAYGAIQIYEGGGQISQPFGAPPLQWTVTSGSLPNGIALQPNTDTLSAFLQGTPLSAGCSEVTLQVTDSLGGTGTESFFVVAVPSSLSIKAPVIATPYPGVSYPPTALVVSGGLPPYTWGPSFIGPEDLPPPLSLSFPLGSTSVGVISGTPDPGDLGPPNFGAFPISLLVNDSQVPYPAVATPPLKNMTVLNPSSLCQSAPAISPSQGYGGDPNGGSVLANAFLKGTYAFLLRGFDAAQNPVVIAGSVQTDGSGTVTGGQEDVTRSSGSQNVAVQSGSYNIGGELNRGCMTLHDSSGSTSTFAFTLASCSNNFTKSNGIIQPDQTACGITANGAGVNGPAGFYTTGRMIESDNSGTRVSGILRMQDASSFSSGLSGFYAFGLSGWDLSGGHYAAAGSMQVGSGAFSSVAADTDDAGSLSSALTGGSGTFSGADSTYGRTTATLTLGNATLNLAVYVVSQQEAMIATTDLLSAGQPIASGEAVLSTGPFGTASLQNAHILHIGGLATTGPDVSIGVLQFDGIGGVGGTVFENQAGTLGTTAVSGIYSVDSTTGRTVFSAPQIGQSLGAHAFVAYILPPAASLTRANCSQPTNCITGFLVGNDSTAQDGILEFQTSATAPPPPFNNGYLLGDFAFGVDETLDAIAPYSEGSATASAGSSSSNSGNLNPIIQDFNYSDAGYCLQLSCLQLIPEELFTGTYSINTNGTGSFGGETVSVTNGRTVFYLDESPLNTHPSVIVAEQ
jgi:hypothetical protein